MVMWIWNVDLDEEVDVVVDVVVDGAVGADSDTTDE